MIEAFYKTYLGPKANWGPAWPSLIFSQSLNRLIDQDTQVCKEKAGSDICGWQAGGDVYLSAQEVDPHLTYQNSGISVTERNKGKVNVKLNVYPSLKDAGTGYERSITYGMVRENGLWVVDDILYGKTSLRQQLLNEIASFNRKK